MSQSSRRWPVVSALGVVEILAWGSSYYLLAVLAKPIVADTGWPLAWVVGAASLAFASAGLSSPLVGRMIAEYGGRPVLATGCTLLAAGLALCAAAPSLAVFYLAWVLIGFGMSAALYDPAFATLGRLYKGEARSAITVLTLWGGFASTVAWPVSTYLLESLSWRGTVLTYAAVHLLVSVPLLLLVLPKEARAPRLSPQEPRRALRLEPLERKTFLVMSAMLIGSGLIATTTSIHILTLFQAQGLTLAEAVAIGALFGPAQVAGRLVEMAGKGRHHPSWSLLFACATTALGLVLMALGLGIPALAMVLFGAGNGVFSIARGALPLALFGAERYPAVMGRLARPALLAQSAAPILGGMIFNALGAEVTFAAIAILGLVNLALAVVMKRLCDAARASAA